MGRTAAGGRPILSKSLLRSGSTAFLDRDGTINESPPEGDYLSDPERVRLLPGAVRAIATLNRLGIHTVVVTNQRGIGRGLMTEDDLRLVNGRLVELLAAEGAKVDAIFHCPHLEGECDCRKPGSGMFLKAEAEVSGVRLAGAAMIGDSPLDILAGLRLDLTTVLIGRGKPGSEDADLVVESLEEAVQLLVLPA